MLRYQASSSSRSASVGQQVGTRREDLPSLLSIRLPFTLLEDFIESVSGSLESTIDGLGLDIKHVLRILFSPPSLRVDDGKEIRNTPTASVTFPFEFYRSDETKRAKGYLDELLRTRVAPKTLYDLKVPFRGIQDPNCEEPLGAECATPFMVRLSVYLSYPMVSEDPTLTPFGKVPRNPMHSLSRLLNPVSEQDIQTTPCLVLSTTLKERIKDVALILNDWSWKPLIQGSPPEFQRRFYECDANRRYLNTTLENLTNQYYEPKPKRWKYGRGWQEHHGWQDWHYCASWSSSSSSSTTQHHYSYGAGKGKGKGKNKPTWRPVGSFQ